MKNLRKAICVTVALMLVFTLGGCGTATNYPGNQTGYTGHGAIGTGTGVVPGTTAVTGTNTGMYTGTNFGTNIGANLRRNLGTNLGATPGTTPGTAPGTTLGLGTTPGTNYTANYGTNLGTTPRISTGTITRTTPGTTAGIVTRTKLGTTLNTMPGTGLVPKTTGTAGNHGYRDGIYTASYGSDTATVTIHGGKVVKVTLKPGKTAAISKTTRNNIINQVISKQTGNVSIKGASKATSNMISAVKRALDKAKA